MTLWGKTISWHVLVPYDRKIWQSKCDVTTILFEIFYPELLKATAGPTKIPSYQQNKGGVKPLGGSAYLSRPTAASLKPRLESL